MWSQERPQRAIIAKRDREKKKRGKNKKIEEKNPAPVPRQ
jgi:hypothetical protein